MICFVRHNFVLLFYIQYNMYYIYIHYTYIGKPANTEPIIISWNVFLDRLYVYLVYFAIFGFIFELFKIVTSIMHIMWIPARKFHVKSFHVMFRKKNVIKIDEKKFIFFFSVITMLCKPVARWRIFAKGVVVEWRHIGTCVYTHTHARIL